MQKLNRDVWSMSSITYPGKLAYKLLTRMMVSFIKERVLSPNALHQVTVGLQCINSFSLLAQKGTDLQQNYSSLNNMCFSI